MADLSGYRIIGDAATFAIACKHDDKYAESAPHLDYAFNHLILGNRFIGSERESSLVFTWAGSLERVRDRISAERKVLANPIFRNRTDREILELINKANQLRRDYDPQFRYLRKPADKIWHRHTLFLDETIDAYYITFIEDEGQLKFIWMKWRPVGYGEFEASDLDQVYSTKVSYDDFFETVEVCSIFLRKKYKALNRLLDRKLQM